MKSLCTPYFLRIFFFIMLSSAFLQSAESTLSTKQPTYLLTIKAPQSVDTSDLRCLYQGNSLPFKHGLCQLPEKAFRTFFALIITSSIERKNRGNCTYIERSPHSPCAWYNLILEIAEPDQSSTKRSYSWRIEKLSDDEVPLRIPEHASIVIQLPPHLVEKVESRTCEGHSVIHLPSLFLQPTLTQETLQESIEEIVLSAPIINETHNRPQVVTKQEGATILTLNIGQR